MCEGRGSKSHELTTRQVTRPGLELTNQISVHQRSLAVPSPFIGGDIAAQFLNQRSEV
jgi:hypothetical protein